MFWSTSLDNGQSQKLESTWHFPLKVIPLSESSGDDEVPKEPRDVVVTGALVLWTVFEKVSVEGSVVVELAV